MLDKIEEAADRVTEVTQSVGRATFYIILYLFGASALCLVVAVLFRLAIALVIPGKTE